MSFNQNLKSKMPITSPIPLGDVIQNIGTMILSNAEELGSSSSAVAELFEGTYKYWSWQQLKDDIISVAAYYRSKDLRPGDKIGFVTVNGYWRLVTEIACMSLGLISVPVFSGYSFPIIKELLTFTQIKLLVTDNPKFADFLKQNSEKQSLFDFLFITPKGLEFPQNFLSEIHQKEKEQIQNAFKTVQPKTISLIMFTSGTSGLPKGVQLSHLNILSQQKALTLLWTSQRKMRFLCYLPWHHSFGGLFERFFALCSGGCLAIDNSWGKNIDQLLKNYAEIKPNVYFSVPKVYQEIMTRVLFSKDDENIFFHPDLKFVFTAAAPLPLSISDVFKSKNIPVAEGWGLTETSPCCTLTELSLNRKPGVVGWPIPEVEIMLDENSDEILVRGPNVMLGYYKRPEETNEVLKPDGWFHTGDIGKLTEDGLCILSRKDRMFKLSNGEKIFPTEIEERLTARCKFIKHAFIYGKGQSRFSMLVFPNFELFGIKRSSNLDKSNCSYPCNCSNLNECLTGCVEEVNSLIQAGYKKIGRVIIVPTELSIENRELTPSFKLIPKAIEERYKEYMTEDPPKDAYVLNGDLK